MITGIIINILEESPVKNGTTIQEITIENGIVKEKVEIYYEDIFKRIFRTGMARNVNILRLSYFKGLLLFHYYSG